MPLLLLALASLAGSPGVGAVHVVGPDYGVAVAVDRRPVGRLPLDPVPVDGGLHLVELLRDGRPVWSRVVYVGPGQTVRLDVALTPAPGPSPTLGDLKRAESAPRGPPTRYRLTGRLAAEAAAAGDAWDLDLAQRWRLEAVPDGAFSAAVEVRAVGDLAGEGPELWRAVHRAEDDPILVETLWMRAAGDGIEGRLGRLPQSGPMRRAFLLDGARIDGAVGPVRWRVRGGQRRVQLGAQPDDPWLGGGGLSLVGDTWSVALDGLYHGGLDSEAQAHYRHADLRVAADASLLDGAPMHAAARADYGLGALTGGWIQRVYVGARWRGARPSPFDLPPALTDVLTLETPAGVTLDGGLSAISGPLRASLRLGLFDGVGRPTVQRPDRRWIALDATLQRGAWDLTARAGALAAESGAHPTPIGLDARTHGAIGGSFTAGRVRARAEGGVERLVLRGPDGPVARVLPVGGLRLDVALSDAIALFGALDVAAAHPSIDPTGGPWIGSRIGVQLR